MPVYSQFAYKPKAFTTRGDIGRGQVYIEHLSPSLFLELQSIKMHLHTGIDSQELPAEATPYMIRGQKLRERVERSKSTWSGSASASGSLVITFGNRFNEAPTILTTPASGAVDIQCVVGTITATGFTLSWKDDTGGTHTTADFNWLAIGL